MRSVASLLTLLALSACCSSTAPTSTPEPLAVTATPVAAPQTQPTTAPATDPVVERAKALVAHAARVEPAVTPLLKSLAGAHQGEMVKLEFRLKTLSSTERKIRMLLEMYPQNGLGGIRIDDALRYTMRVDDTPPGRYVEAAKATLADLESKGHEVQYVKNYWPKDDNYSGINSVLKDASGLFWELQFHTSASFSAQSDTRPLYEEMREVHTPLERKRELFDAATKRWNEVPIPKGVLEKGVLHQKDQVRERPRP